jgi:hypothetical protein
MRWAERFASLSDRLYSRFEHTNEFSNKRDGDMCLRGTIRRLRKRRPGDYASDMKKKHTKRWGKQLKRAEIADLRSLLGHLESDYTDEDLQQAVSNVRALVAVLVDLSNWAEEDCEPPTIEY